METLGNVGLYIGYGLIILAALSAIGFTILDISRSPGAAVKALIGLGTFILIVLISYMMATTGGADRHEDISESFALFTSTALYTLYITGGLALLGLLGSLVYEIILESIR